MGILLHLQWIMHINISVDSASNHMLSHVVLLVLSMLKSHYFSNAKATLALTCHYTDYLKPDSFLLQTVILPLLLLGFLLVLQVCKL